MRLLALGSWRRQLRFRAWHRRLASTEVKAVEEEGPEMPNGFLFNEKVGEYPI
jgi:hypothetical protein